MAYKNPIYDLVKAYYDLLENVIPDGVFKDAVHLDRSEDYILIRAESMTIDPNKHLFQTIPVVIIEIVTFFDTTINAKRCNELDEDINELIFTDTNTHAISIPNHHISTVRIQTSSDLPEDGVYRRIIRYENLINQ